MFERGGQRKKERDNHRYVSERMSHVIHWICKGVEPMVLFRIWLISPRCFESGLVPMYLLIERLPPLPPTLFSSVLGGFDGADLPVGRLGGRVCAVCLSACLSAPPSLITYKGGGRKPGMASSSLASPGQPRNPKSCWLAKGAPR